VVEAQAAVEERGDPAELVTPDLTLCALNAKILNSCHETRNLFFLTVISHFPLKPSTAKPQGKCRFLRERLSKYVHVIVLTLLRDQIACWR